MNVLQYVAVALAALNEIVKAGGDIAALIAQLQTTIGALQADNRDPTQDEWNALNAQIAAALEGMG
jgi:hypothetical protein